MEKNPMARVSYYKGYLVEYTGIPDDENPIGLYFDSMHDTWHILISGSISPFLIEVVAEAIINRDSDALENILRKSGLLKAKPQFSTKVEIEFFEICAKMGVKF